ncbi:MAG: PAS domain S-box protein [Hydrococcus sp. Prado102]|jgi:PAS domain S-box-containing protein|nr:PAS domain S-box protein [Hydrococcus sp. Prado102]
MNGRNNTALAPNTPKKRNYTQIFLSYGGYLLPGAMLLLGILWVKSQEIDINRHNEYLAKLRQMQELDARIDRNVLQARDGLLSYYDPIVNDLAKLKQLQNDLKQTPSFIDSEGQQELDRLLQSYARISQKREESILRFQSQNAVLLNSLTYFPIAIADLVEKDPTQATRLNALLRDILLFNLSTDKTLVGQINLEIHEISVTSPTKSTELEMALTHARIILNRHTQVNDLVAIVMDSPTDQSSDNIALAYNRYYQQAIATTNNYRLGLYLLSIVLLVGISTWIVLKIRAYAAATQQAEEKYRSIFENSVSGIFQSTPDGRFLSANSRLAAIYGYESVEALLEGVTDIEQQIYVMPERRQELVSFIQEQGAVANFESLVYRQDKMIIWISENTRCVRDCNGKLLYYEGTVTDISDRKQAEAALQASEEELRLLFAAMTDTVIVFDERGRYLNFIQTQSTFVYKPRVNRIGKTVDEVLPKDVAELFKDAIRRALYLHEQSCSVLECPETLPLDRRMTVEYSLPIQGKKTWFSANVSALSANTVLWVARDMSDRKRTEEALQRSETKFRNIFENSQVGIFRTRIEDGLILEANQRMADLFGFDSPTEIMGVKRSIDFYIDSSQRQRAVKQLQAHGELQNFEVQLRKQDGTPFWGLYSARLDANTKYVEGVIADISDRKKAEAALQEAKLAAESANRTKSQFLANMSHELRTPLNVILGFTQLMLRDRLLTPQQQEHLGTITRSGEHLLELINDVLEMSKIEAGQVRLNENNFDLYYLLDVLEEMWRPKAASKGIQLIIERQADIPQYIKTDESKLRQVLMNLLSNAIKFTRVGSIHVRARNGNLKNSPKSSLSPLSPKGNNPTPYLHFEVEDTGEGIAQEEIKTLFNAFVQTETGRRSQQGTGLGLAISREFVRLMGGEIILESQVGRGTKFMFYVPVAIANTSESFPKQRQGRVVCLAPEQPHYRLLIVEDKWESRQLLLKMLEPLGFEIEEASNGQEAIAQWESFEPHLIWMDLQMPVMDGYEATKQIKSHLKGQATVIIALTASAFEEDRVVAISAGCDDFVRKPFREEEIFDKMAHYLGVRYVYEPLISLPKTEAGQSQMNPEQLDAMPVQWREKLHQAATQVDGEQILQLIEQIPTDYNNLALALTDLANSYRFDRIVSLIQPSA